MDFMQSSGKARIIHFYIANAHRVTLQMGGVSSHELCMQWNLSKMVTV